MSDSDDEDVSAYERQRMAKMQRNKEAMQSLGLGSAMDELKRKRQEARREQEESRKRQKATDKATFVPRRTSRDTKPVTYIQSEWQDPAQKNRQKMDILKKRLAPGMSLLKDACLLCGLVVPRPGMRQHVGAHIVAESFATIRCGFCGVEGSTCQHKVEAGIPKIMPVGDVALADLCPRYYPVDVKKAAEAKCTNVPLRCSKCSAWQWTYTMKQHWSSVHGGKRGMSKKEAAASTVSADEVDDMMAEMERINIRLLEKAEANSSSDEDGAGSGGVARRYTLRERKPLAEIDTDDNEFSSAPDSDYSDEFD